jgi:hypothetical protein
MGDPYAQVPDIGNFSLEELNAFLGCKSSKTCLLSSRTYILTIRQILNRSPSLNRR